MDEKYFEQLEKQNQKYFEQVNAQNEKYFQQINAQTAANNAWSAEQAQKAMDYQTEMSNTAHQREVADLKAAGLNPVLSAGGAGATTGSGVAASASNENITAMYGLMSKALSATMEQSKAMQNTAKYISGAAGSAKSGSGSGSGTGASSSGDYPFENNFILSGVYEYLHKRYGISEDTFNNAVQFVDDFILGDRDNSTNGNGKNILEENIFDLLGIDKDKLPEWLTKPGYGREKLEEAAARMSGSPKLVSKAATDAVKAVTAALAGDKGFTYGHSRDASTTASPLKARKPSNNTFARKSSATRRNSRNTVRIK